MVVQHFKHVRLKSHALGIRTLHLCLNILEHALEANGSICQVSIRRLAIRKLKGQGFHLTLRCYYSRAHDPTSGPGEYFFCNFSNQAKPKHRLTTGGHLGVNYIKARLGTPPHTPKHLPIARALSNDARTFERTRENAHGGSGLGVLAAVGPPTHSKTPQSPTGMCENRENQQ